MIPFSFMLWTRHEATQQWSNFWVRIEIWHQTWKVSRKLKIWKDSFVSSFVVRILHWISVASWCLSHHAKWKPSSQQVETPFAQQSICHQLAKLRVSTAIGYVKNMRVSKWKWVLLRTGMSRIFVENQEFIKYTCWNPNCSQSENVRIGRRYFPYGKGHAFRCELFRCRSWRNYMVLATTPSDSTSAATTIGLNSCGIGQAVLVEEPWNYSGDSLIDTLPEK